MLECIARIRDYTREGPQTFLASLLIQDAVVRNLQVLAESSQRLSEAFKSESGEVDWRALSGFRNILVHDYLALDLPLIWLVVENEMSALETILKGARGDAR
ncbi:MAG: DUF86 domain-containing protein [Gammaproteobacteria bacterium]